MNHGKIDQLTMLLFVGIVVFSCAVGICAFKLKDDGQTFLFFTNLASGFFGAFANRIKPAGSDSSTTSATATGNVKKLTVTSDEFPVPAPKVFSSTIPPPGDPNP